MTKEGSAFVLVRIAAAENTNTPLNTMLLQSLIYSVFVFFNALILILTAPVRPEGNCVSFIYHLLYGQAL